MTDFILLPAIDIADGRAVRPRAATTTVGEPSGAPDPSAVAREYVAQGASWLHVVDLDRARASGSNDVVLAATIAAARKEWSRSSERHDGNNPAALMVQVSGGVREVPDVERAFDLGADWVNLACDAIVHPHMLAELAERCGDRISISLDIDADGVSLRARGTEKPCGDFAAGLSTVIAAGIKRVVITDGVTDGAMVGPGLRSLELALATGLDVIASGGVSSTDDLRTLAELRPRGLRGAIAGTALAAGAFTVADALDAIRCA